MHKSRSAPGVSRRALPITVAALAAVALLAPPLRAQSPPAGGGPAVLAIQLNHPVADVSPTLYGLMTEEINHAYEGGLYAEMVRNGTCRADWTGVPHWYLVQDGDAQAAMKPDRTTGPSAAIPYSLRLTVARADAADPAGVLNTGYWGMAIRPRTVYNGSFYAKESSGLGPVTASLVADQTGKVLASAVIRGIGAAWRRYAFTLRTGSDLRPSAANHLVLTVAHPGTLWLNVVTLFPPTYDGTPNGNRPDIMKLLAAMHPRFLRFPGGNYLEGRSIAQRFNWKKTIGPLVDRPGHWSPWGYWSTDEFGLLQFLDWCQDLHMQPVLAVYAGYSLNGKHVAPGPALAPYVRSALQEIQYVIGGPGTPWGAVRARDGHPQPFPLRYVEIGNEDFFDRSGSYDGRFAQFYKAIKAKYPQLQIIATAPVTSVRPDVLDQHYYQRAIQFFHDVGHYDHTSRTGPKIFVGEWATRQGSPTPNFGAALGDAAWMTGLERDSDLIVMASYAPLLTNVNPLAMQWAPDLIGYNALRSYGSPSYYAQVMFANYLGTVRPAATLAGGGPRFFESVTATPARCVYLKLVNAASTPQPITVRFSGAALTGRGELITLEAANPQATNSLRHPRAIIPRTRRLRRIGSVWRETMPAYSIQVLQADLR